jgi:hypothetical protein
MASTPAASGIPLIERQEKANRFADAPGVLIDHTLW